MTVEILMKEVMVEVMVTLVEHKVRHMWQNPNTIHFNSSQEPQLSYFSKHCLQML
jgi:hypothetical protein